MSTIDHFGLFGAQQYSLSLQRAAGLAFIAVCVFMVLNKVTPATT